MTKKYTEKDAEEMFNLGARFVETILIDALKTSNDYSVGERLLIKHFLDNVLGYNFLAKKRAKKSESLDKMGGE